MSNDNQRTGRKAVRVLLPTSRGNYLLQKALTNPKYVRAPGGGVEEGESFEEAAIRELKEEFNINAKGKLKPLGWHTMPQFNEYYYLLKDHGLKPGKYQASNSKSEINELLNKKPQGNFYWGPDVKKLLEKTARERAKGIPDRKYYGSPTKEFKPGELIDYVIQRHLAERAGPHYDLRAGDQKRGLHSWVTRKELPEAGGRIGVFQQPVHSYRYKDYEGIIPPGYGAGRVSKVTEGKALVTKTKPGREIHFTTADNKPERRYALVNTGLEDNRQWILARPQNISDVEASKPKYKNIPPDEIDERLENLKGDEHVQPKVDGALNFLKLIGNKPELLSHRRSKETGLPIVHTEKFFGGRPEIEDLPKYLQNSILLSEVYGSRKGQAIPPQELGGLLNATTSNSLQKQKDTDTELRGILFDIARRGHEKIDPEKTSYSDRRAMIEELLKYLPDKFELPEEVQGPEAAKELLAKIRKGHHPLTEEGLVIHPEKGRPEKVKLTNEHDVYIRDIFPGEGKYFKSGAGGIQYSLTPEGPIVGKVGTGLSDELRRMLFNNPEEFIGRIARIRSQGQFESGAHRAPALTALHEDF